MNVFKIFIYLLTAVQGYTLLKHDANFQLMTNLKLRNKAKILKGNYSDSLSITLEAIEIGLQSVNPVAIIKKSVMVKRNYLTVTDYGGKRLDFEIGGLKSIYLVGAGKATASMVDAFLSILKNDRVKACYITVPYGIEIKNKLCLATWASHPIPDSNGVLGTEKILEMLEKVKKNDFVIMFLSGGASALMPLPIDNISLTEKQNVTKKLLSSGATIDEMNTVRKHLSKVKGGRLAEIVNRKFRLLTLILSDVVQDKIDVIASGPTVPDLTTFEDAKHVLVKYKIWNNNKLVSKKLKNLINDGISGNIRDTPKPGNPIFSNIDNVIIGNNTIACQNIKLFLEKKGVKTRYLGSSFTGKAADLGSFIFRLVRDYRSISTPYAFVFGGETTVDLKNKINGLGGRNQEAVLSAASHFKNLDNDMDFTITSFGTDGIDGNSQAAGGVVNQQMLMRITQQELRISKYLKNHDSNALLNKINGAI